ncbi:MAG: hypothetical protein LBC28_02875, partial [Oscillospiraceae bacterium]|nr:hypothetical protein [Oscillospiraceae bacterium]
GETWRVGGFFAKLDYSFHKDVYRASFPVMERICACGVDCISTPVKTVSGALYTEYDGAVSITRCAPNASRSAAIGRISAI